MKALLAAPHRPGVVRGRGWRRIPLAILLIVLTVHAAGVGADFLAAIRTPLELDYGEGIVWQQAVLMFTPRGYGTSTALPFVVFHYPPIYYVLVHAARLFEPDYLAAGRIVAALCTVLIALPVAGLVLIAASRPGRRPEPADVAVAVAAGLLALCAHPLRMWGEYMRVDMAAVLLGMAGLCVGAWANGRFRGTAVALLLCTAAVFAKQTQLSAGIAVFTVALLRNPRGAVAAAAVAGVAGLAVLGVAQLLTGGGFLLNLVYYNINRYSAWTAYLNLRAEAVSIPLAAVMVVAGAALYWSGLRHWRAARNWRLRGDAATTCRVMVGVHFALAAASTFAIFKSGAAVNYFIEWACAGSVVTGILLVDLACDRPEWTHAGRESPGQTKLDSFPPDASRRKTGLARVRRPWVLGAVCAALIAGVLWQPLRLLPDEPDPAQLGEQAALVDDIAASPQPVLSENMTLLMRAGRQVTAEPSIVTELAGVGHWDETPLLEMIRDRRFAFLLTTDDLPGPTPLRSAGVAAAARQSYPRIEPVAPGLWRRWPQ